MCTALLTKVKDTWSKPTSDQDLFRRLRKVAKSDY